MKAAGITRIDHLIVTHYHTDHVGGVPPLLATVPVGTIYDHGLMSPPHDPDYASNYEAYVRPCRSARGCQPATASVSSRPRWHARLAQRRRCAWQGAVARVRAA